MGLGAAIFVGTSTSADSAFSSASQVEVYERAGETTTYAIRLPVTATGDDLSWLADSRVAPGSVLTILVSTGDGDAALVHGPVTGHAARIAHGGAGSYVDVMGADASVTMDRTHKTRAWEDARDSDAVSAILGEAGFTPDVSSTDAMHRGALRALAQCDTDLRFVRRLARRNGFLAWLSTDATTRLDTFHFRAPQLDAAAAATLVINQSGANVDTVDLRWDSERPSAADAMQLDPISLDNLDATGTSSSSTPLGSTTLSSLVDGVSVRVVAPGDDSGDVTARARGAAFEAEWFVQASLETTLAALGTAIRAHSVVEVQGLGSLHSGKYLVAGVRHLIDATAHRMTVDLVRNAWGS